MSDTRARTESSRSLELAIPPALDAIVRELFDAGHTAHLVGASLRELLSGARPQVFELSTDAPVERVTDLFGRGVLISTRHGIVTVPTPDGPVDIASPRAGPRIEDDLAHRDFTVNAMAYDIVEARLLDPFDGRRDLEQKRLRAVRCAADRLRDDPLRALRAVRLLATRGFTPDPELEAHLGDACGALAAVPREPVRRELSKILLSPNVEPAMDLLERSGIAAALAPKAAPGAGALLAGLPRDLELRLAGWLLSARARRVVQSLRFSRPTVERVEQLVRLHPIDAQVGAGRPATLSRFLHRTAPRDVRALLALREAEIATRHGGLESGIGAALGVIQKAIENQRADDRRESRRGELAVTGADVMKWLACEAGPRVGRALSFLTDAIERDPSLNTPDGLRKLLKTWDLSG